MHEYKGKPSNYISLTVASKQKQNLHSFAKGHIVICAVSIATDHMTGLGSAALLSALHRRLVQISGSLND